MKEFAKNIILQSETFNKIVSAGNLLLKESKDAQEAKEYIYSRISKYNIDKFGIGYFPNDDNINLLVDMVGFDSLEELRLVYKWQTSDRGGVIYNTKSFFDKHNIIFPYRDEYGNIIALVGRTLLSEEEQDKLEIQKYKNTFFNKSLHLFGLNHAKNAIYKRGGVIVVEGQIDCLSCYSNGIHNVVALGGTSFGRFQLYLLKKYSSNIYLLLDNDKAGDSASHKIIDRYSKYANINQINFSSDCKDVDEYLKNGGNSDIFSFQ